MKIRDNSIGWAVIVSYVPTFLYWITRFQQAYLHTEQYSYEIQFKNLSDTNSTPVKMASNHFKSSVPRSFSYVFLLFPSLSVFFFFHPFTLFNTNSRILFSLLNVKSLVTCVSLLRACKFLTSLNKKY